LIVLSAIFLPLCVSTPINYDTAEISDDSTRIKVGGGVQGFKGQYTMSICGSSSTTKSEESPSEQVRNTEAFVQADLSPYFKVGIPSRSFRFSLKVAPQLLFYYRSPDAVVAPSAYADLLFGVGSPEWLTTGLRFSMIHGVGGILSLHRGRTTLSFMALYWPGGEDKYLTVSAGLGYSIK